MVRVHHLKIHPHNYLWHMETVVARSTPIRQHNTRLRPCDFAWTDVPAGSVPQSPPRRCLSALPLASIPAGPQQLLGHPCLAAALLALAGAVGSRDPSWAHGLRRPARRWRTSAQTRWRSCGWWICLKTARTHPYVSMKRTAWSCPFSLLPSPPAVMVFSLSSKRHRSCLYCLRVCWVGFLVLWCPPGHPLVMAVLQRSN